MRHTTGRCHKCLIRFTWQGAPLLRDALCPYCNSPLQLTTHLWHGESQDKKPATRLSSISTSWRARQDTLHSPHAHL